MASSSPPAKPTVVIVPGAWHPASCFKIFQQHLHEAGYPTTVASLPSVDPADAATADCASDALFVRSQYVLPVIDGSGGDVLIMAFSYGGIPASGSAMGLSKTARAKQGQAGGVVGLVLVSAIVLPEGKCLVQGKRSPMTRVDYVRPNFIIGFEQCEASEANFGDG